eukprot:CAMPEP_0178430178 /NCGR_PEP_ID=MMETSP0689_2-20121128/31186_1 /TAXON_ID=160604 /ORGANISM="Amphidinium massartii, Strain CS-259" /LENGTH=641 /DNA_ID=CAMNT_0020052027 /DNA_START=39 /DNA_END=1961 /DNA_ORIENTATION=+
MPFQGQQHQQPHQPRQGQMHGAGSWHRQPRGFSEQVPAKAAPLPLWHESQRKWNQTAPSRGYRARRDAEIETVQWGDKTITPVQKNLNHEPPSVQRRSQEECVRIRGEFGIHIEDSGDVQPWQLPKVVLTLEEAGLPDWANEFLEMRCWQKPFPIQMQAWPAIRCGHDVIARAPTGSGKSMAYILPMVGHVTSQHELAPGEGPVGLVLVPTRELCDQVAKEVNFFSRKPGLTCASFFGGTSMHSQFQGKVDIAVATPGRMSHMLQNNFTNLDRTTFIVIDEADELLEERVEKNGDPSMRRQVEYLIDHVRPDRQVVLFSATMPDSVAAFAKGFLKVSPLTISVGNTTMAACKDITQYFAFRGNSSCWPTREDSKVTALCNVLEMVLNSMVLRSIPVEDQYEEMKVLVFVNRSDYLREVVNGVNSRKIMIGDVFPLECQAFRGDLDQERRAQLLKSFKERKSGLHVLVSTSALGRGHDFPDLKYVVNFDYPESRQGILEYIHRIGRTGRAGKAGNALTLMEDNDIRFATDIKNMLEKSEQNIPDEIRDVKGWQIKELWAAHRKEKKAQIGKALVGSPGTAEAQVTRGGSSWRSAMALVLHAQLGLMSEEAGLVVVVVVVVVVAVVVLLCSRNCSSDSKGPRA